MGRTFEEFEDMFESEIYHIDAILPTESYCSDIAENEEFDDFENLKSHVSSFVYFHDSEELITTKIIILNNYYDPIPIYSSKKNRDGCKNLVSLNVRKLKDEFSEDINLPVYAVADYDFCDSFKNYSPKLQSVLQQDFYRNYETDENEIIALIKSHSVTSFKEAGVEIHSAETIAVIFCDTTEPNILTEPMQIRWLNVDDKKDLTYIPFQQVLSNGLHRHYEPISLHEYQICRLKVRKQKEDLDSDESSYSLCLAKVLEDNYEFPELKALLDDYLQRIVLHDDLLGDLQITSQSEYFKGVINWGDEEIPLYLDVDRQDKNTWLRARFFAREMVKHQQYWDNAIVEKVHDVIKEGLRSVSVKALNIDSNSNFRAEIYCATGIINPNQQVTGVIKKDKASIKFNVDVDP